MLLMELAQGDPQLIKKLFQSVANMTHNQFSGDRDGNIIINAVLRQYPQLRYTGSMYRMITIDSADFAQCASNAEVIKLVRNYNPSTNKHVYSFSKTMRGVVDFNASIADAEIDENEVSVVVVLRQHGTGLDISKTRQLITSFNKKGMDIPQVFDDAVTVKEVVAPIDPSIQPVAYTLVGVADKNDPYGGTTVLSDYTPAQFQQLKHDMQQLLDDAPSAVNLTYRRSGPVHKRNKAARAWLNRGDVE